MRKWSIQKKPSFLVGGVEWKIMQESISCTQTKILSSTPCMMTGHSFWGSDGGVLPGYWMQAPTLQVCPAPLTITAFMYFFGTLQVGSLMLVFTGGNIRWSLSWGPQLFSVLYAVSWKLSHNASLGLERVFPLYNNEASGKHNASLCASTLGRVLRVAPRSIHQEL